MEPREKRLIGNLPEQKGEVGREYELFLARGGGGEFILRIDNGNVLWNGHNKKGREVVSSQSSEIRMQKGGRRGTTSREGKQQEE